MTTGDERAAWLLACIADDEAVARAATEGPWTVDSEAYAERIDGAHGRSVVDGGRWGGEASVFESTEDALHIARWDPSRVLYECGAKRGIVQFALRCAEDAERWAHDPVMDGRLSAALVGVRQLVDVYREREGWRPEWGMVGVRAG